VGVDVAIRGVRKRIEELEADNGLLRRCVERLSRVEAASPAGPVQRSGGEPAPAQDNGQPRPASAQGRPPTLLGVAEQLLAGAAVAGAAIYVLLNALYVEFYDDFGLRPEEVGLDRLAVLGRAAWLALVPLLLTGPVALVVYARGRSGLRTAHRGGEHARQPSVVDGRGGEPDPAPAAAGNDRAGHPGAGTTGGQPSADEVGTRVQAATARVRRQLIFGSLATVLAALVLIGYFVLRADVERKATRVKEGRNVGGIGRFVEFIDVRAAHAEVTWLGEPRDAPPQLRSPYLMYLGRGPDVAAFLACGRTTVVVPAEKVAINLLDRGVDSDQLSERQTLPAACVGAVR
jgi:hypothetical protein